jgi:hypothetical protein
MYVDRTRTYIGVVEDNEDPKKIGRCRIRVIDIFDDIPKDDIPWASPWKDLNGNEFNVPEKGKVVTVVFDSGNVYKPEYLYAEHYNINLENKLQKLSGNAYTSMKSIIYDHKTQIYSNDDEGLMIDYKFHNINIKDNIDINLKDNYTKINLGDAKSDQQAILGTNFMNWFDDFISNLLGEKSGPYLGNLGSPVVANPEFIEICQKYRALRDPKFLSNNVYITSNFVISTVSDKAPERPNDAKLGDNYKSTSNKSSSSQSQDAGSGGDYTPQVDPNNQANISNDPEDKTPKTKPEYLDPNLGPAGGIISDFAKELVNVANTQIGIFENPRNSNTGPEVEGFYQRSTFLNGTGWAWCAAFVCYLFKTAASKKGIQYSFKLPKTAGAYDFKNWANNNSKYIEVLSPPFNKILPGDVIIFNFSHIGLSISQMTGSKIDTIEGNTDASGSREGGGVYKKSRNISLIKHVLRIKYNDNLVNDPNKPKVEEKKTSTGNPNTNQNNQNSNSNQNNKPEDIGKYGKFVANSNPNAPLLVVFGGIDVNGVKSGVYMFDYVSKLESRYHVFVAESSRVNGPAAYSALLKHLNQKGFNPSSKVLYLFSGGYLPGKPLLTTNNADFSKVILVDIWMGNSSIENFYIKYASDNKSKTSYFYTTFGANSDKARDTIKNTVSSKKNAANNHMKTNDDAVSSL